MIHCSRQRSRIALLIAIATAGVSAQSSPIIETGTYFEVVCNFDNRDLARAALATAEATWPIATNLYGLAIAPPPKPLRLHIYRDPAAYRKAELAITNGQFQRNLAFAHFETKSAHVAVQPRQPDAILASDGLNYQTQRLIVHESAHLVRFYSFPNYRSHPDWFADGNASWLEPRVLKQAGLMESVADTPSFSSNILRVQRLLGGDAPPTADDILHDRTDDLEFYDRYALRWLFFRFIVDRHGEALRETIQTMSRFGSSGLAARVSSTLRRLIGPERFPHLDAEFLDYASALQPVWHEPFPSMETHGDAWTQAAFDQIDAEAWRATPITPESFDIAGTLTILRDGSEELSVLIGDPEAARISITFTSGYGVTVSRRLEQTAVNKKLQSARIHDLRAGREISFRISYSHGGELSVDVLGEQALEIDLTLPVRPRWGLAAVAGSTGIWQRVLASSRE